MGGGSVFERNSLYRIMIQLKKIFIFNCRIDFENNPSASKPANLANSAVLRMLEEEEEEQRRSGSNPGEFL